MKPFQGDNYRGFDSRKVVPLPLPVEVVSEQYSEQGPEVESDFRTEVGQIGTALELQGIAQLFEAFPDKLQGGVMSADGLESAGLCTWTGRYVRGLVKRFSEEVLTDEFPEEAESLTTKGKLSALALKMLASYEAKCAQKIGLFCPETGERVGELDRDFDEPVAFAAWAEGFKAQLRQEVLQRQRAEANELFSTPATNSTALTTISDVDPGSDLYTLIQKELANSGLLAEQLTGGLEVVQAELVEEAQSFRAFDQEYINLAIRQAQQLGVRAGVAAEKAQQEAFLATRRAIRQQVNSALQNPSKAPHGGPEGKAQEEPEVEAV